jgi:hypothetical protein
MEREQRIKRRGIARFLADSSVGKSPACGEINPAYSGIRVQLGEVCKEVLYKAESKLATVQLEEREAREKRRRPGGHQWKALSQMECRVNSQHTG